MLRSRLLPWLLLIAALAAFGAALWRPDDLALRLGLAPLVAERRDELWQHRLRAHDRRLDASAPAGATILLGDSNVQGLNGSRVGACTVNLGIGGETSAQLAVRVGDYASLERAAVIVVLTGLNDVLRGRAADLAASLRRLLAALPPGTPLLLTSLPRLAPASPAGRAHGDAVARANEIIATLCRARPGCRLVDLHHAMTAPAALMEADGIHLNPAGQALWVGLLRQELAAAGVADRSCAG